MQARNQRGVFKSVKRSSQHSDLVNKVDRFTESTDGLDRRGFLKCMAWAGTGLLWTVTAEGIPTSHIVGSGKDAKKHASAASGLHFVQISDSHMGFNKPANTDVAATLQVAIDRMNALPETPEFIIHTGDLSHQSKAAEFDAMDQILKGAKPKQIFYVPGEHDTSIDDGKQYLDRYGKNLKGRGWYSFDHKGVHFVGLVNVIQLEGMGQLGDEQISWLKDDLSAVSASTPVVVFAHIPLWTIYPDWGWGTKDSEQAFQYLKRFGSVTVLNGHIHQVMQKVEGNATFHTAMSTAFPQPAPGTAPAPGPMKVPAERLRSVLGLASVNYIQQNNSLAIVDTVLGTAPADGQAAPSALLLPTNLRRDGI
ncbi:MAG: metallophosphoesterase [Acidobacteria bacterium]|nr:metallophosphoesterase [Acidobacteriota bacterium]MBV9436062.1 metallophosphoesterase [Acidobacteriota bacterium]